MRRRLWHLACEWVGACACASLSPQQPQSLYQSPLALLHDLQSRRLHDLPATWHHISDEASTHLISDETSTHPCLPCYQLLILNLLDNLKLVD